MADVGAGILNIITESLYDKPIVVFREYVQNSADSFLNLEARKGDQNSSDLKCVIWRDNHNLFFLDNGTGIEQDKFREEMVDIGKSPKRQEVNYGYKGIGRLSGLAYCEEIVFANIHSLKNSDLQIFTLDGRKLEEQRKLPNFNELIFSELMDVIGRFSEEAEDIEKTKATIEERIAADCPDMFNTRDSGFLVVLKNYSFVLEQSMNDANFYENLGWLLPVPFKKELLENSETQLLFQELYKPVSAEVTPAKPLNILFDGSIVERPITQEMLRKFTCKLDLQYAIGFQSFESNLIKIKAGNPFSGIRIYIDNMLLCDETELIPALLQFGLINHTSNELLQTVRAIGAVIYITDKVNIVANARRTFIEVTDNDAINFLKQLAEFIERIFQARYALSKYQSAKKQFENTSEAFQERKKAANDALLALAKEKIELNEPADEPDFQTLSVSEKKRVIKKKLDKELSQIVNEYINQISEYNLAEAFDNFKLWLKANLR